MSDVSEMVRKNKDIGSWTVRADPRGGCPRLRVAGVENWKWDVERRGDDEC